jgi:hypothetical protein
MFHEYHHETMWEPSWEEVDELDRATYYHRETMAAAFVNGTGEYLLNILPRSRSMAICYFAGETIDGLEDICYPQERNPDQKKVTLYFDNELIHNTIPTTGQLEQPGFKRMDYPTYGPDLAPCDFFFLVA